MRSGLVALAGLCLPLPALARGAELLGGVRRLSFYNTHTGEALRQVPYWEDGRYLPDALAAINEVLRDHRTDEVHPIDPGLFDLLHALTRKLDTPSSFHVISGYRSPHSNALLRTAGGGGVAKYSLHMDGKAVDVRLPGVQLARLRKAALTLRRGGVGYYPDDGFVHLDTGRVRTW